VVLRNWKESALFRAKLGQYSRTSIFKNKIKCITRLKGASPIGLAIFNFWLYDGKALKTRLLVYVNQRAKAIHIRHATIFYYITFLSHPFYLFSHLLFPWRRHPYIKPTSHLLHPYTTMDETTMDEREYSSPILYRRNKITQFYRSPRDYSSP
jgi:hypothetical protein